MAIKNLPQARQRKPAEAEVAEALSFRHATPFNAGAARQLEPVLAGVGFVQTKTNRASTRMRKHKNI